MKHPFHLYMSVSWTDEDVEAVRLMRKEWARKEQDSFAEEKSLLEDKDDQQTIRGVKKVFKEFRKECQRNVRVHTICLNYLLGSINGTASEFPPELRDEIEFVFSRLVSR